MLKIYSKNNCSFCVQAKRLLEARGYVENIDFEMIKIDEDMSAREFVLSQGHKTVPQLYLNNQLFVEGGFQGLSKMSQDELDQRLKQNVVIAE